MKCYFALSDDVSANDGYYAMFLCALESARKNTTLDLHCLYDFRKTCCNTIEEDRIYQLLKKYDVTVHLTSIDFEDALLGVYTDDYLAQCNVTKSSLYSRFLRFMLADEEKEDEYVFYADTDVIFLKDFDLHSFKNLPETVGVCPEFKNNYSYSYFNAGIMLINIASYRKAKKQLIDMLVHRQKAPTECCDQGYLNVIYEHNFIRMDNAFNWKPYWGINENAVILHLHGLKPCIEKGKVSGYMQFVSFLMKQNRHAREGWMYYFSLFADYASSFANKAIVMENIEQTMNLQRPEDFTFIKRVIRKAGKILGK